MVRVFGASGNSQGVGKHPLVQPGVLLNIPSFKNALFALEEKYVELWQGV